MRRQQKRIRPATTAATHSKAPFIHHLHELRQRLLYVVVAVIVGATLAYFVQEKLVHILLAPSHNQQFIYTSPAGGIGFLFQICTYVGIVFALPIALAEFLIFISPVIGKKAHGIVIRYSIWSGALAAAGLVLGYKFGLPSALHFLGNQFDSSQIHPLFTIQEYMSFVTYYLLGAALLFQVPLVLVVVNRIKPIPPKTLWKMERFVIVFALVISMIMVPTVNLVNLLIIALPVFLMYQFGFFLVWRAQHQNKRPVWLVDLLEQDQQQQSERAEKAKNLSPLY